MNALRRVIISLALSIPLLSISHIALAQEYDEWIDMTGDTYQDRTVEQVKYGAECNHGSVRFITGWSYVMSGTHDHSSTVTGGGDRDYDWKPRGTQSHAQLWLKIDTFRAYWQVF